MNVKFVGRMTDDENPGLVENIEKAQFIEVQVAKESEETLQKILSMYTENGTKRLSLPMRRLRNRDIMIHILISGNGQGNIYKHAGSKLLEHMKEHRASDPNGLVVNALFAIDLKFIFWIRLNCKLYEK
jgi:hypothetical protein